MKRFSEQFKKRSESLKLSVTEKQALRERVVSYMEYHPLPEGIRSVQKPRMFSTTALIVLRSFYARRMAGALAVMLMVAVPVLAERSVPGDVLYPIKVRFNEEVRSSLTSSPYEQVAWETERLERRLAEARVLESEGKLTPEVAANVAEAVKQHSDAAQKGIAAIRESDSDEAAIAEITFSSALDVQSEMLEGGSETLAGAVDSARQVAQASQQLNRPSFEKLLGRIELESTNVYELLNTVAREATSEEQRDVEQRLTNIRKAVANAQNLKESNPEKAVTILATALADMRKVISFMTDIDVRSRVSIEELVPAELSDDERAAAIVARQQTIEIAVRDIESKLETVDANTRDAVTERLVEVRTALATASSTLIAGELEPAEEASTRAASIIADILSVLAQVTPDTNTDTATSTDPTRATGDSSQGTTTPSGE